MTRLVLAALAVIALAARAHAASRVRIDPPPPFYADDRVRITIESDYPHPPPEAFSVRGDGLSLQRLNAGSGTQAWEATFYSDSGRGTIEITAPPPVDGPLRVPFTIQPALIRPWSGDPAEHLRQLIAAQRVPAIVVAEASSLRPYVGQAVAITWWQYVPFEASLRFDAFDDRFASYAAHTPDRNDEEMAPLAGIMMKRRRVRMTVLTPSETGRIPIPPMQFQANAAGRPPFMRLANALELDVQPLPAAAKGLPIGSFAIVCGDQPPGFWPSQLITVRGAGANTVQSLTFEGSPLKYAIVVRPSVTSPVEKQWVMSAHERQVMDLPRASIRYFDPVSGTVQTATCEKAGTPRAGDAEVGDASGLLRTPQERRAVRIEEARDSGTPRMSPARMETALQAGRAVSFTLAAIGLIGLLAAFRA